MMQQMRRLTQALMVSGALNIALLALFFYWMVKDKPLPSSFQLKPAEQEHPPLANERSGEEFIRMFRHMPLEQLIAKLKNQQLVENGYTQRDLALASLITFHYFDLPRALSGLPLPEQKRVLMVIPAQGKGVKSELVIYPGLTEEQYQAIVSFADTERWPLTTQGLFLTLKRQDLSERGASLVETFYLTPEFMAVEALFMRSGASIDRSRLLQIILEGDWTVLRDFAEQQKISQDLSPARRQKFLLDYIAKGSKGASYALLQTDGTFAARKLDDQSVTMILKLLDGKTPEAKSFALEVLSSPRSDGVLHLAAARLYEFAGEAIPTAYSHEDALSRFLPQAQQAVKPAPIRPPLAYTPAPAPVAPSKTQPKAPPKIVGPAKKEQLYMVQEGDSLWKISRRFKVDVDAIRKLNRMQNDNLKPGTTLKIP